jgi:hypothetical protein
MCEKISANVVELYTFCENQWKEAAFFTDENELTFTRVP